MGISELTTKIIRTHTPQAFISVSITNFSGKRIAVDAHNLIYRIFAVVLKNHVIKTNIVKDDLNREKMVYQSLQLLLYLEDKPEPARHRLSCR